MNQTDRAQLFHVLGSQLHDNAGQRLTLALINGLLATIDATLPREAAPPAAAPEPGAPS